MRYILLRLRLGRLSIWAEIHDGLKETFLLCWSLILGGILICSCIGRLLLLGIFGLRWSWRSMSLGLGSICSRSMAVICILSLVSRYALVIWMLLCLI